MPTADPTINENPFEAIRRALWRKIDDSGSGGGAELLHQWATSHNPQKGLTAFRVDDADTGGFPTQIRSGESPALYIGCRDSQRYVFGPTRTLTFPEQYEISGVVASRDSQDTTRFLWLVLRALWWDYPRLLDANGQPLAGTKSVEHSSVMRSPPKKEDGNLFWRWSIFSTVTFCADLQGLQIR